MILLFTVNHCGDNRTIGALKSGGTIDDHNLLLGIEKIVGDNNTVTSEFEKKSFQQMFQFSNPSQLEQVTIHEYVHTLQKNGEINVLSKAIKELFLEFMPYLELNGRSKAI